LNEGGPPPAIEGLAPQLGWMCQLCNTPEMLAALEDNTIFKRRKSLRDRHHLKHHAGQPFPDDHQQITYQSITHAPGVTPNKFQVQKVLFWGREREGGRAFACGSLSNTSQGGRGGREGGREGRNLVPAHALQLQVSCLLTLSLLFFTPFFLQVAVPEQDQAPEDKATAAAKDFARSAANESLRDFSSGATDEPNGKNSFLSNFNKHQDKILKRMGLTTKAGAHIENLSALSQLSSPAGALPATRDYARIERALRALVDRFLLEFNKTKAGRVGYLIAIIIEEEDRAFNTVTEQTLFNYSNKATRLLLTTLRQTQWATMAKGPDEEGGGREGGREGGRDGGRAGGREGGGEGGREEGRAGGMTGVGEGEREDADLGARKKKEEEDFAKLKKCVSDLPPLTVEVTDACKNLLDGLKGYIMSRVEMGLDDDKEKMIDDESLEELVPLLEGLILSLFKTSFHVKRDVFECPVFRALIALSYTTGRGFVSADQITQHAVAFIFFARVLVFHAYSLPENDPVGFVVRGGEGGREGGRDGGREEK